MRSRLSSCEGGQAITEFALVLPVLLLLLLGIIELSRVGHAYLTVQQAARDAVRYVSVSATDGQVAAVIAADSGSLEAEDVSFRITPTRAIDRRAGLPVTVEVSYPVQLITPLLSELLPNPYVVRATVTMRKE